MNSKFNIKGMTCSACQGHVEKSVATLEGVNSVSVSLLTNSMNVEYNEAIISTDKIIEAVKKGGYSASLFGEKEEVVENNNHSEIKIRLTLSFVFLVPLLYISMGHMVGLPLPRFFVGMENSLAFAFTQFLLCLPILYLNRSYYINGFKALFNKAPNMDSLIAIGSLSAVLYGIFAIYSIGYGLGNKRADIIHQYMMDLYFESAGTILTLITLGKYLESKSKVKTGDAIGRLFSLMPEVATVIRDGIEMDIITSDVKLGEKIVLRPGYRIPVDGIIIEGRTYIDESAISGESMPVEKNIGDRVIGGTINKGGYVIFEASAIGEDTTLSQIIRLVEDASATKAPIGRLADKVSYYFVPAVISIAFITSIVWLILGYSIGFSLSLGIAVLVISCPCALGLATPTAIMVGTGKGAELGILIKSAESLEITHTIDTVVLDKTGTITKGHPTLTNIIPFNISSEELLKLAVSVEKPSQHPISEAILKKGEEDSIIPYEIREFDTLEGMGVTGICEKGEILAGNKRLFDERSIKIEPKNISIGETPLFIALNNRYIGCITVSDKIKETSIEAINSLKAKGIEVIILTGDNKNTGEAVKNAVGADLCIAEVLPKDKEEVIKDLISKGKRVCMVGDGINDAPALTRADVGIAIGAGSDIAIDSADIILIKNDLCDVVTAIELSHATIKNIKENLFWAFFYNIIGIPIAMGLLYIPFGIKLNPMLGSIAMSLSSIFVVTNALRLNLFKKNTKKTEEFNMKKEMIIEGMMCSHCSGRVDSVLNKIDGVTAKVSLEDKKAYIDLASNIDDSILKDAVEKEGYKVISIK